jgi:hypothetical protein
MFRDFTQTVHARLGSLSFKRDMLLYRCSGLRLFGNYRKEIQPPLPTDNFFSTIVAKGTTGFIAQDPHIIPHLREHGLFSWLCLNQQPELIIYMKGAKGCDDPIHVRTALLLFWMWVTGVHLIVTQSKEFTCAYCPQTEAARTWCWAEGEMEIFYY